MTGIGIKPKIYYNGWATIFPPGIFSVLSAHVQLLQNRSLLQITAMFLPLHRIAVVSLCSLIIAGTVSAQQSITPEAAEFFERQVRPLLLESCVGCHSQAVNKVKGGLNMDSRQAMVEGGDSGAAINLESPEKSLILEAVRRESIEMPPDKPLTSQQIAIFEKWLKMGAPWPESKPDVAGGNWIARRANEHWAWHPIKAVDVPIASAAAGVGNSIDAFINRSLAEQKITASPPAERHELVRRMYFDLIGLPPTPEQVAAATGPMATSDEQLVDRLLASPEYGVRWSRHWLDLVRYAETLGHEFDYPIRHAWRYREAVVNALNDDVPYDKFISDHIAGDLETSPRINPQTGINESLALTAWWWMGDSVHAPVDVKNDWATRLENQVDVFSKSFLGMTIACARCHDHKFDAIGVSDYYGMVGVAKSIRRRFAITDPHDRIANHRELLKAQFEQANPKVQQVYSSVNNAAVQQWLDQQIETWRALPADQLQQQLPIGSPLYALRLLVEQPPADKNSDVHFMERLNQLRQEAARSEAEYAKWQSESQLIADFSHGLPAGWKLEAIKSKDFTEAQLADPKSMVLDWFDGSVPMPSRPSSLVSDRFGRSQFMTLRSPNFTLTNRCVCIKMRGKSTQSMVCVDGYFMTEVQGLLFADLRKPIDQPNDWGWVVHAGDLNKYIGDPTFLSLEAESNAWFQISEVRLADRGPPASPSTAALKLLNSSADSRQAFRAIVIEYMTQSLHAATSTSATKGSDAEAANRSEQVDLARAMLLRNPELLLGDQQATVTKLSQQIVMLASQTPQPVLLLAAEEGDPHDAAIELRGNPHRLGDSTPRGCFQSLAPWNAVPADSSGRMELVKSLTSEQHPLVARVIVNRVWHHLMGRGIVASTDNLGVLGSRPTHPELLDHLATQFMQHGWSIKWLIREIVSSQAYRRSSTPLAEHATSDPDGSLYSHRSVRRLDAEVLRDAMLATCESLDSQITGPSVPIHLTEQMTGRGRPGQSGPLDGNNRRSAFIEVRRNFLHPFLLAFDFPMPSTTTGKRNVSNVPAQALGLLNDPMVDELAKRWVARTASITEPNVRVSKMIETAFSRPVKPGEIHRCVEFVSQSPGDGWLDLAHTLINAKEFWYLK